MKKKNGIAKNKLCVTLEESAEVIPELKEISELSQEELSKVCRALRRMESIEFVQLRHAYGMTQEQIARALNVSLRTVSRWETTNSCPDLASLLKILELIMSFKLREGSLESAESTFQQGVPSH